MDILTAFAVVWGALMLLQQPCRGVLQGGSGPLQHPVVLVTGSFPPWEEGSSPAQEPTYETPHTSPIFVRAEPVALSEPQGTGWQPMHPSSWPSQPHPDNPAVSMGPVIFPGNKPPITAAPTFPQGAQGPVVHPVWANSIPSTPETSPLPQLSNDIPQVRTSPLATTRENPMLHPVLTTRPDEEGPPDTTHATAAADATVPLSVNAVSGQHKNHVQQQSSYATTTSSSLNDFSPLRVPGDLLDEKNAHREGVSVNVDAGGSSVTATPNETSTPPAVDKDSPNIESPEYPLAGGAVAGIVIGSIASVALLAGLITYIILRRPFLKLLNSQDKSSSDNVAYIDDTVRSGYMNTHIELPKENSEEMTSLDNDSFLNSLEAVTIQNYWADNSKNTNV
ncbi:uncharacterized protein LOC144129275 [Amblyomma americanum]